MIRSGTINIAHRLATERYAALGVDVDRALKTLSQIPISLHCWQGDDVGGFENFGGTLGGGTGRHRQLSRQSAHAGRTARRPGKGVFADPRQTSPEPARLLRRIRRQKSGPRRNRAEAFRRTGLPGPKKIGLGLDFNPTCFSHPKAADGFTLSHRGQRHPQILDRALHPLARNRRGHGQGARQSLRDQRLDSRRHEGHARRPRRPARAARRIARRRFQKTDFAQAQPRRRRTQTVRHRQRKLRRRLA